MTKWEVLIQSSLSWQIALSFVAVRIRHLYQESVILVFFYQLKGLAVLRGVSLWNESHLGWIWDVYCYPWRKWFRKSFMMLYWPPFWLSIGWFSPLCLSVSLFLRYYGTLRTHGYAYWSAAEEVEAGIGVLYSLIFHVQDPNLFIRLCKGHSLWKLGSEA